jgi:leucine efflux protein
VATGITDLSTFILGTIFIVLLPGPNSLYVMTLASRQGLLAGYRAACGIFVGDTVLMLLAATGAASALHASPAAFAVLKYTGAGYLGWLGLGLIRAAFSRSVAPPSSQRLGMQTPFQTALVISLLNPKAIMFFISFFIQFVDPNFSQPALSFLILGIIVQIVSALYLSALILGGTRLSQRFSKTPWVAAAGKATVGILFVGFAVKLAL